MENTNRLIILYDYYESLLTDLQRKYFENYYFDNLSLSEIAENENVSRNAVHNQLKNTVEKLENYESKLNLYNKSIKIEKLLENNELKEKIMNILEGE